VFVIDVGRLPPPLIARRDPKGPHKHAFVEPADSMTLGDLQRHLCGSRTEWEEIVP
jgi:hypothetical protein